MSQTLISVCVPCFNVERFIAATLDSVLAQTYRPIEVVVVDDGSTDGSGTVLEQFRARGVTIIRQGNGGAARARNLAFEASRGEYVLFLDGDDLIGPEHIQALVAGLGEARNHLIMGQWDRFSKDPSEAMFPARPGYRDASGVEWMVSDWTSGHRMTQCGQFLIPRRLLEHLGGWDERLSLIDDFEFFARLIAASDGIRFTPEAKLFYRSGNTDSLSGQSSRKAAESACLSLMLGTQHLLQAENSARTRAACSHVLQHFDFEFYPDHPDLRRIVRERVRELGGTDAEPVGPPGFHALRRWIGWKAARRIQRVSEHVSLTRSSRRQGNTAGAMRQVKSDK